MISSHRLEHNDFIWEKVEMLDMESHYNKRIVSEIIHIKKQRYGLNKQSDGFIT